MSELYERIVSQKGGFERLVARIPGFRGYLDLKARREADRMLRDFIAGQLQTRLNRMATIEKNLLEGGGLAHMSETSSARTKWQLFHDRVKTAAPGYTGFFAQTKIGAEELERVYSFDEAQVIYVDRFDEALTALAQAVSSKAGIEDAIRALDQLAVEANEAFTLRDDVLTNLSKSLT